MKNSERKKLGQSIDELYALERKIKKLGDEEKKLRSTRFKLETELLKQFNSEDIKGSQGLRGKAAIKVTKYPTIKDHMKFQKYVKKNGAFDLYQRRINQKAYFDRLEEGEAVPGVEIFNKTSIKVSKA